MIKNDERFTRGLALADAAGDQEVDKDGDGSGEENHAGEPPAEAVALFVAVEAGLAAGGPLVGSHDTWRHESAGYTVAGLVDQA